MQEITKYISKMYATPSKHLKNSLNDMRLTALIENTFQKAVIRLALP